MNAATISKLDQTTICADDLRSFIEVLDKVPGLDSSLASEMGHITANLRVALGKWHRSIAYNTGRDSIDRLPHRNDDSHHNRAELRLAVEKIQIHLSRLVVRHTNYAFGAANVPSKLDVFFPQTALNDVRVARVRLRRVVTDLNSHRPPMSSVTVTEPALSVCAW